jgi:hypothetical protein
MGDVYDLDAAKAAQREALGEPFTFSYAGEKYQLPPSAEWPVRISALLAEGNIQESVRILLSTVDEDSAARFLASNPTMGHVNLIIEEAARRENMELPNSSPPPPSGSSPT